MKFNSDGGLVVAVENTLDGGSSGLDIPTHDRIEFTNVGSTNNIDTVVYKKNNAVVATLTFSYFGGVPTQDDADVQTIQKT